MTTVQPSYSYTQKARGFYSLFAAGFAVLLAVLFFLTRDLVFVVGGVFLTLLVFSGIYAFFKDETWNMSIAGGVLSWSYARWPKSSGRIELSTVRAIVVDDCSSTLTILFTDDSSRKIKLLGHASRLRDYLAAHYPHIVVEYVAGT